MNKYLIFGINGMAGHVIAQYLMEQGHAVTGFARNRNPTCNTILGDARREDDVRQALDCNAYTVVVNCIGVLNRFVDENLPDGIYLNSVFPHFLSKCMETKKTKLIHISTDCVFSGKKGQYTEYDVPDATSYYGRSKALGEVVDEKNLTIRTSIVGPELKTNGIGLFHWFMNQESIVNGYEKVLWSGVTTLQLAKIIEADSAVNQVGLYHLVNNRVISKHDLLGLFNRFCRNNPITIQSETRTISDKTLYNTHRIQELVVPSYEQMVREMAAWITLHPGLYGQYADR